MSEGRCTNEKPTMSACCATKSRGGQIIFGDRRKKEVRIGKLTPFSAFSRAPLARTLNTSNLAAPLLFETTRAPILPSSIQTSAPTLRRPIISGNVRVALIGAVHGRILQSFHKHERVAAMETFIFQSLDLFCSAFWAGDVHQDGTIARKSLRD